MHEHAAHPVVIFLPVSQGEPGAAGIVVDPVCGRTIRHSAAAGRLLHRGQHHYFCSLGCAQRFAADPGEFQPR